MLIAAHHLNKRDGVIIGDVVGLGKTMTASALAKIFEDDFYLETLIICPKNIVKMWDDYVYKYQLRAKVMPISVVQNELPDLRRYRLVIIDESHNLRNREGKRYRAIREYIKENASKVIIFRLRLTTKLTWICQINYVYLSMKKWIWELILKTISRVSVVKFNSLPNTRRHK